MFIREKINRSGTISVVVINKNHGKYKEIKSFGVGRSRDEVINLRKQAESWMNSNGGQLLLDFDNVEKKEYDETIRVVNNVDAILINGTHQLLGGIYDDLGFSKLEDNVIKNLVMARVSNPTSKLSTMDYLKAYFDEDISISKIYRHMDMLYDRKIEDIHRICVNHSQKVHDNRISITFYDVTTLYFETTETDALREPGYSKDGKFTESQVVLGLLVDENGYPLSYSLYNGKQYEGFTMIPLIDDFKQRYSIGDDFVVIADSGLMNKKNVRLLQQAGYKYIIGAKIKNESKRVKEWILKCPKIDNAVYRYSLGNGQWLILSYSSKRATKDACNRLRGIARLRKNFASGKLTKDNINARGYKKFVKFSKDADKVEITLDEEAIKEDKKWDGLKGYITNTSNDSRTVINRYHGLSIVEAAFRTTKGTLKMRPIYHYKEKRIEAHIAICFMAYLVYKELERIIKLKGIGLSVNKVLNISKSIATLKVKLPNSHTENKHYTKTLFLTPEHNSIRSLFNL